MSRLMMPALAAVVVVPSVGSAQAPETRYVAEPTIIRVEPRAGADSAGTMTALRRGNLVGVHGCARGWCEVTYYPRRGFVEEARLSHIYVPYDEARTAASGPTAAARTADLPLNARVASARSSSGSAATRVTTESASTTSSHSSRIPPVSRSGNVRPE